MRYAPLYSGTWRALMLGVPLLVLAGCVGKPKDPSSQVVAIVNHREITVSQLTQLLQGTDPGVIAPDVTQHAIDSLVSEELLVQGAVAHRLDRDPAVVQEIEAARRQVLARYFAERDIYPKKAISAGDIQDFYKANPILFAERKRFQLKNFSIASVDLSDHLQTELDQTHTPSEIRDLLEKHDIKYASQAKALTADQLPVDKLGEFAHASVGDLMIAQQGNGKTLLMFIAAIEDDNSMSFDRAKPYIELYLANLRNGQAVTDYLKQAKAVAKIDYTQSPAGPGPRPSEEDRKPAAPAKAPASAGEGANAGSQVRLVEHETPNHAAH